MDRDFINSIEADIIKNLPVYIFQDISNRKMKLMEEGRDVIDLGMGNPDRPAPPPVIERLAEAVEESQAHRYSASRGVTPLREEICRWYKRRFGVSLDPEEEAIVCIGSKEGISHLALAVFNRDDSVLVPNPTYPSHIYSVAIAGANVEDMPITKENGYVPDFEDSYKKCRKKPRAMILSYPNNPTAQTADMELFRRAVRFAEKNRLFIIHDNPYCELGFDGYRAPSFLQAEGAKENGIEFYSLSKTYNMAGWRVGFAVGNRHIIKALAKLKSYYDYGTFTPIQMAAVKALQLEQSYIDSNVETYRKRRDILVEGLNGIGWKTEKPVSTMYVWAEIPPKFKEEGSMEFTVRLIEKAGVAVAPGIGFGKYGEGFVRIALVESEDRIKKAVEAISEVI